MNTKLLKKKSSIKVDDIGMENYFTKGEVLTLSPIIKE